MKEGKWVNIHYHDDPFVEEAWRLQYRCPFCSCTVEEYYKKDTCPQCGAKLEKPIDEDDYYDEMEFY